MSFDSYRLPSALACHYTVARALLDEQHAASVVVSSVVAGFAAWMD